MFNFLRFLLLPFQKIFETSVRGSGLQTNEPGSFPIKSHLLMLLFSLSFQSDAASSFSNFLEVPLFYWLICYLFSSWILLWVSYNLIIKKYRNPVFTTSFQIPPFLSALFRTHLKFLVYKLFYQSIPLQFLTLL